MFLRSNMNKGGQLHLLFSALFFITVTGIILFVFSPTINEFRLERINDTNNDDGSNTLLLLALYALMPGLWFFYVILSMILIILIVGASRGSPL
jgi:uncharacterized membrane protein